ncbi:aldo/keto reductase [Thermogemmatispora carboxidivorans]|uniref:aldo/keto reductase n=1 Tax=Thermogemmatispora carboxidivorans TaxID=1382306 RepID=UPI00069A4863|nr:aldo/keto reductase [Thermogemmatispora carboxidivorans]
MPDHQVHADIPWVTLNNGVRMPQLGLGVFLTPKEQTISSVLAAFENGYRLIDTAAAYRNEEEVGEAIRQSGLPREELFITSKLWNTDHGYDQALKGLETSLKKLGLDYLDLYLIHWPLPMKGLTVQTWKGLERAYKDGKVRAIGVSNFKPAHLERLLQESEVVPAVLQIELHPTFAQEETRNYAKAHGIQVESWFPLGGQGSKDTLLSTPLLRQLADKYGKTPAQIVLRWHVQLGLVVIPKSVHAERIRENCQIFDFELSQEEVAAISALDTGVRLGPDPDTFGAE